MSIESEVKRRRTFAIISHPDAGKTTLTEKLLLFAGAIQIAGSVKARKASRHATSDWMEIEKQRGISISSSVLQFEYDGFAINLLDTPGHKDFSEDTYRTLMAADAAVMLIDAAKGVEPQTRKLFEVCRMRGIPIFTFINKMDRPGQDPLDLMDEIEKVLGIRCSPMTWPIGSGDRFRGVYDLKTQEVHLFQTEGEANVKGRLKPVKIDGVDDPKFFDTIAVDPKKPDERDEYEAKEIFDHFKSGMELVDVAGDKFDLQQVLEGQLSPLFFGSAMNNFGVELFLRRFIEIAPTPLARESTVGKIEPTSEKFSSFVFKIQANMDPSHRDRVAFMRVCSGKFTRAMQVNHVRLKKAYKLAMPFNFFAQERVVIDEAWPGDIVGMLDTSSSLRIGDTLCEGTNFEYAGVPQFSPEHFSTVRLMDPMKRKQLQKGLDQLSEEGVIQIYRQPGMGDKDPVLGAVGSLQFEVLKHRLLAEYAVDTKIEPVGYTQARWVSGDAEEIKFYASREDSRLFEDRDGHQVLLFRTDWALRWAKENAKKITLSTTAPRGN